MHDHNNNYYHNYFESTVASDEVKNGRPSPDMIFKALESHRCFPMLITKSKLVRPAINLGDTVVDVQSGVAAGCVTGAVLKWSNAMAFAPIQNKKAYQKVADEMFLAGADFTIDTMEDLPSVLFALERLTRKTDTVKV